MIAEIFARIRAEGERPVWISLADEEAAVETSRSADPTLPLAGVPFAVKDNIDVAGMETTAGCPAFAYRAERTAPVVERLQRAGATLIGKTNMDQFATGLVGVRSPYGVCSSVFDDRYISGGSSSGSAVAVAKGLCAFALGTDTAGSGRVPAAFNNLVGLKPTRGLLSMTGVVPACRSLDCVSIFARTATEAAAVWRVARGFDAGDPYARLPRPGEGAAPWLAGRFRFGVPGDAHLEFFGDDEAAALYRASLARLEQAGGERVTIDYSAFAEAARLLYAGPWVAERFAAVGAFLREHPGDAHPVVEKIILDAEQYSAVDAHRAAYQLEELKRLAEEQWRAVDVLALPTTGTIFTIDEVLREPVRRNTDLGCYTNFVNLMDLAAVAVPAGFRANGLPFGISLIGRAFSDEALLGLAQVYLGEPATITPAPGCVLLAVAGAHLSGQPLNGQLTELGARLVSTRRTAACYRLYALANVSPPKPGLSSDPAHNAATAPRVPESLGRPASAPRRCALMRDEGFAGPGIEVEVWAVPENSFGGFVAGVPPPLAIGSLELDDGAWIAGFVCEPEGLRRAAEITSFGGWRAYLGSRR